MAEPTTHLTLEALGKLTVAQLKAICKERKITGYSKLPKPTLIQKIHENVQGNAASPLATVSPHRDPSRDDQVDVIKPQSAGLATLIHNGLQPSNTGQLVSSQVVDKDASCPQISHSSSDSATDPALAGPPQPSSSFLVNKPLGKHKEDIDLPIMQKRKKTSDRTLQHISPPSQGLPMTNLVATYQPLAHNFLIPGVGGTAPTITPSSVPKLTTAPSAMLSSRASGSQGKHPSTLAKKNRKRFIPLVVKKPEKFIIPQQSPLPAIKTFSHLDVDFGLPPALPNLFAVSMPPSLAQRKHVVKWSIAFSLVSPQDLFNLAQCSRLFRYAAYISATRRLERDFSGQRLTLAMKRYSPNTTNMWPYLRGRQEESATRQRIFLTSFLGRTAAGRCTISHRLWTSPDNAKQATIAVRFLLTRFYFEVSIGLDIGNDMTIVDVQEVVEGEIWSVELSSARHKETFYVLEATCEVVGHPSPSPNGTQATQNTLPLRADWSAYIQQHIAHSKDFRPARLMERLKWTNYEEYDRGISKLWLSRTHVEGEIGPAKRLIAERYVLACVVSNSISGRWMTSTEMAQESNGLPTRTQQSKEDATIHLFLPTHHLVESLHFVSSNQGPLHPAVAVVQTPSRGYFILRDNGMQIGCEEEGVAEVWMHLIGCDADGQPL